MADRGHAHVHRLDRDLVFGKSLILVRATDPCFAVLCLIRVLSQCVCLFLTPTGCKRLVLLPVGDRGVEFGSVIDTAHGSDRHFLFGLVLGRGLGPVQVADRCSSSGLCLTSPFPHPCYSERLVPVPTAAAEQGLLRLRALKRRLPAEAGGQRSAVCPGPEAPLLPFLCVRQRGVWIRGVRARPGTPSLHSTAAGVARRAATAAGRSVASPR